MERSQTAEAVNFLGGYQDDDQNCEPNQFGPPSKNLRVTLAGEAVSRMGYEDTGWDLNVTGKPARALYMEKYNVTFFTLDGKLKYVEHDRGDAVVDTGLNITAGTITRMEQYAGDLYLTNPTDGIRQIHVFRLNDAAPTSGDGSFTIDQDGGARLNAFGDTSGTMKIRGTSEAYSAVTTAGVVTHSTTLSQTYADNDIAITIEDISSSKPFASKLAFWKERMIAIGVRVDTNVDSASHIAYMSQFASARDLQKVVVFGTSGGATEEWIGKAGSLTNIVTTRDYCYLFKEDEVYYTSPASVDLTTGATLPQLLSNNYGCTNEDCAADLGSGLIAFLTNNKRIVGIRISTETGAAVVFPDESFDQPIRNTLDLLDADQSSSHMFYHKGKRLLYVQVSVQGEKLTLVYDNNIKKWLPPDDNKVFANYFEKKGILFSTAATDDAVYEVDRGTLDDDQDVECVMCPGGLIETGDGRRTCEWEHVELSGSIARDGMITVETPVGGGTAIPKTIDDTGVSFASARSIGDIVIGDMILGNGTADTSLGDWDRDLRVAPTSYGPSCQVILSSNQMFSLQSYCLHYKILSEPLLTLS